MFYEYLFYKSYQLAQKSKNFDDTLVLGGIWGVVPCFLLNIYTVMFLVDALTKSGISNCSSNIKQYKYIFSGVLVISLLFYYKRNGRWKNIIKKYEEKEANSIRVHPAIVLLIAYVLSFILCLLSAMYKNGDGILLTKSV